MQVYVNEAFGLSVGDMWIAQISFQIVYGGYGPVITKISQN